MLCFFLQFLPFYFHFGTWNVCALCVGIYKLNSSRSRFRQLYSLPLCLPLPFSLSLSLSAFIILPGTNRACYPDIKIAAITGLTVITITVVVAWPPFSPFASFLFPCAAGNQSLWHSLDHNFNNCPPDYRAGKNMRYIYDMAIWHGNGQFYLMLCWDHKFCEKLWLLVYQKYMSLIDISIY